MVANSWDDDGTMKKVLEVLDWTLVLTTPIIHTGMVERGGEWTGKHVKNPKTPPHKLLTWLTGINRLEILCLACAAARLDGSLSLTIIIAPPPSKGTLPHSCPAPCISSHSPAVCSAGRYREI